MYKNRCINKEKTLLVMLLICILSSGCRPALDDIPEQTEPIIIVKAISAETGTRSTNTGETVFTGNDILWFNESTKELRFRDNVSNKPIIFNTRMIGFYIGDEFLFSSMINVSSLSSQIFNSLVFYYDITGNRYFLLDGYPEASVLSDPQKTQELRNENRQKIASEWSKFIEQLKIEDKYKN
jgi:hypothetical protein